MVTRRRWKRLMLSLWLSSLPIAGYSAPLYKWQDDQGKWHFSDKAPADTEAHPHKLETLNITEQSKTNRQMKKVFPGELPEEKQHKQQSQKETPLAAACEEARKQLKTIQGPVVFLDANDNPIQVTEEQRQQRADKLARDIARYCP